MKSSFKAEVVESALERFRDEMGLESDSARKKSASSHTFELFAIAQVLKQYNLPISAIENGIVDGSGDAGIDAFFVFLNGMLLDEDSPYLDPGNPYAVEFQKSPLIEAHIIQCKASHNWEQVAWDKLALSVPELLDPDTADETLDSTYTCRLITKTGIFRKALNALSRRFPRFRISISYVTLAPEGNISKAIEAERSKLQTAFGRFSLAESELTTAHIGVESLYDLIGQPAQRSAHLRFAELIRTEHAFVGLVKVTDYLAFLEDDAGALSQDLFNANVRDFEGTNAVNKAIAQTLEDEGSADFWWQNNGVTILASQVACPVNTMAIENPLVVNGLQTSQMLFNAAKEEAISQRRKDDYLLVRVISSQDDDIIEAVISGTNRQTTIPESALYASNPEQVDIERYFESKGWYYERRRKYYSNRNVPQLKRVSMLFLAQAVMTLAVGKPNTARARPTTLLAKDGGYEQVFESNPDCEAYLTAARMLMDVESYLRTTEAKTVIDDKTNVLHYTLLAYYMLELGITNTNDLHFFQNYHRIELPLAQDHLYRALSVVVRAFEQVRAPNPSLSMDNAAKGPMVLDALVGIVAKETNGQAQKNAPSQKQKRNAR